MVEYIQEEIQTLEKQFVKDRRKLQATIGALQDELNSVSIPKVTKFPHQLKVTTENSNKLSDLNDLLLDDRTLGKQLEKEKTKINAFDAEQHALLLATEIQRLQELSQMQQSDINELRSEIRRLSKKTGLVLPPSKPSSIPSLPPI